MHLVINQIDSLIKKQHDYRAAVETGADAFFPKPMTRTHLLRFVASASGIF